MPPSRLRPPLGLILAVCAILGAVVAVAALAAMTGEDGAAPAGDRSAGAPAATSVPPSTVPPTTAPQSPPADPPPADVPCPAETPAAVCEAAQFVQRETGRAFRQFPVVELADDETFEARLLEGADEDLADVESSGRTLTALGLLDPGLDVVSLLRQLYSVGVVGFYDPVDDVLVVRGTDYSPYTRIVIVHELVHALDDQWFDIDRSAQTDADSELAFGFSGLVEGHASVIETRYRQQLSRDEQRAAAEEEMRLLLRSDADLTEMPPVLLDLLGAPYVLGEELVEELVELGGTAAVTEAFERPPSTSEQLMHPERYRAAEPKVDVPTPPADGPVVEEDVMGEYGLRLVLDDEAAAEGWGGDRYVTWSDGDASCTRIDVVFDTDADLAEARRAFERWAEEGTDRSVADAPGGLRATTCVGP